MQLVEDWRPLFHSDDLNKARVVATCVAAMEYDVRLRGDGSGDFADEDDLVPDGPFQVLVPAADWRSLVDVLD
ncbi:MAG: hypothetical protein ACYTGC_09350, partial [Planctomycetota bacterium]